MSSDRQSDGPSDPAEGPAGEDAGGLDLASLLRLRGAPLLEALERHLPGSRRHAEATASYAFAAAVGLGFDRARCEVAREAALLHEIGLIYVPSAVIEKSPQERDPAEADTWAGQYQAAYQLARGAGIPEQVCGWLLRVRERFDGAGPEGIAGDRIPIESRLMRAACVCQTALAGAPADRPALRVGIEGLSLRAGGELDPGVVAALIAILERAAE
jgi:HD-GYP domain-containing protein (c-di-GMP phosphodiesterase class II)